MNWFVLVIGFLAGFLVAGIVAYFVWARIGHRYIHMRRTSAQAVSSVVELQPFVKHLMAVGSDQECLYVRFESPLFLVRVRKRQFRRDPDVIEIEVRNSDSNTEHYDLVRSAIEMADIRYRERFTPKLGRSKDLRMRVEVGTLAPAAVGAVFHEIAKAIGADDGGTILVSGRDPVFWKKDA